MHLNYTPPPTAAAFMRSNASARLLAGPIGSGKTVACCMEILRRSAEQAKGPDGKRRTRWVVTRNTYRELTDATLRTWMDWLRPTGVWRETDKMFTIKLGDIEAEVLFRALDTTDDTKKLLSLELTGGFLSEVREIRQEIIEAVRGRIGRFPSMRDGGPTWHGLIMDTNMPVIGSYHYAMMEHVDVGDIRGSESDWDVYRQPGGRSPMAENLANLPEGYYEPAGRSEEYVRVMIDAEFGTSMDGLPVFGRSFRRDFHVLTQDKVTALRVAGQLFGSVPPPIIVGFDPGMHCAAVLGQLCQYGQAVILDELVAQDMGAQRFANTLLKPLLARRYANRQVLVVVDPAGVARTATDESSVVDILRREGLNVIPARTNALAARIGAMERLLMRQVDGLPGIGIADNCVGLVHALGSDYRYKLRTSDKEPEERPVKNKASHIADAAMYFAMHVDSTVNEYSTVAKAKPIKRSNYMWV